MQGTQRCKTRPMDSAEGERARLWVKFAGWPADTLVPEAVDMAVWEDTSRDVGNGVAVVVARCLFPASAGTL